MRPATDLAGSDALEEAVAALLAELTLDEKAALTAGADMWRTRAVAGRVAAIKMTDGPVGARGEAISDVTATSFPCGSALGASWDADLLGEVGRALAAEARSKGAQVLLGPTVNLQRHPLAGRTFECFSEDPELTARLAVALIDGLQGAGVGAAIKHFVCNDQEHDRTTVDVDVDEVTLRELYLRPFEAAVAEAKPWLVMAAYNRVCGTWCCENADLLSSILKAEWGFDGVVVSDWWATHSTTAARAGLDLEMPGPGRYFGPALAAAVRDGRVDHDTVTEQARRILRLLARTGARPQQDQAPERADESPGRRALSRRAATAGMVLLRNNGVLPLARDVGRVAVIGPAGRSGFIQGGGSAVVFPHRVVTLEEGLRAALGPDVGVAAARGVALGRYAPPLRADLLEDGSWRAEFWPGQAAGPAVVERRHDDVRFTRFGFAPPAIPNVREMTVRFSTVLTPDQSGEWEFCMTPAGHATLRVAGRTVITHEETGAGYRCHADELPQHRAAVELQRGAPVEIVAEVRSDDPTGGGPRLYLGACAPNPLAELHAAVGLAADADIAIVTVGTGEEYETEGVDRADLALPGDQNALVEAILDVQPNTVVVVNAGGPLELPWAARAAAILWAWFPGQELGHAVADVLTGASDPGGRLPCAFPVRLEDTAAFPTYPGAGGVARYAEGRLVGQRHHDASGVAPAWPLGHGLSYAAVDLEQARPEVAPDGAVHVEVCLRNGSDRSGVEVIQVYGRRDGAGPHEPRRLLGFAKVQLSGGELKQVVVTCPPRAFASWDTSTRSWRVDEGRYLIEVGRSAGDIRHRLAVDLPERRIPTPSA